jgi:hypothetical protein
MEYLVKTTDLSEVTVKLLSHNVVSSTPRLNVIRTHDISGDRHHKHDLSPEEKNSSSKAD